MADYVTEILPDEIERGKKSFMANTKAKLKGEEGFIPKARVPTPGDRLTIGHGHTGRHAVAGATMDRSTADTVLQSDIEARIPEIIEMTPGFLSLDEPTQRAIMNAHFRGDWRGSPKTRKLFNEGRYSEAATEFLNHDEYRNAVARGRPGIRRRMEDISRQLSQARRRKPVDDPAGMAHPGTGNHPLRR